jgi:hypothetical protein
MDRFEKEKILGNLLFMEKLLNLDDDFPSLDYCMKLLRRGPKAFTQFIDILITTRQNGIVYLLLNTN